MVSLLIEAWLLGLIWCVGYDAQRCEREVDWLDDVYEQWDERHCDLLVYE